MKNILYIEHISPEGHLNFNRIYINALLNQGYSVDVVSKCGYFEKLAIDRATNKLAIPKFLYIDKGGMLNRLFFLFQLFFLKVRINFNNYDYILFSSFEEMSFYFSRICKNVNLVCHDNIRGLESPIKKFFLKKISLYNQLVVFNDYIKDFCTYHSINNTQVISHGLVKPYFEKVNLKSDIAKLVLGFDHILFSPSSASADKEFLESLICSDRFNSFLKVNKVLFIIKGSCFPECSSNIRIIDYYLSSADYESLFMKCDMILVSYPSSFRYRVSGVLMECFSNNKKCFLSKVPALEAYAEFFNDSPYFSSQDDLIFLMTNFISNPCNTYVEDVDKIKFEPSFLKLKKKNI